MDAAFSCKARRSCWSVGVLLFTVALATAACARESGDPITLKWIEGDVAGMTRILSPDGGKTIGFVEFHQERQGNRLKLSRVARFADGSSDEDTAEADVSGERLVALRGRQIIRDKRGKATTDLTIDIAGGHISGFSGVGKDRETYDEKMDLPPATYWGPLIFIVIKNFDINAEDGKVVFHTVAVTPKPRSIDMEVLPDGSTSVRRPGGALDVTRFALKPTINWLIDPIVQRMAPKTTFSVHPGSPPAMARFDGPRNYAGQEIRLE